MPPQIIPISDSQLILTGILVLITAGISGIFQLGLVKSLLWGTIRCVLQLSLVGYALAWIFSVNRLELVIVVIAMMALFAAQTSTKDTEHIRFPDSFGLCLSRDNDLSRGNDCFSGYYPAKSMV